VEEKWIRFAICMCVQQAFIEFKKKRYCQRKNPEGVCVFWSFSCASALKELIVVAFF
jgi:hypothetical protein